ncbi:tubulin-like doman-containing protein [Kutzneria sp. CA-103260]|uniref:tubulin-like doman-containing protein n=1 Tax=Kutzneria sp. CA-103260 TaxID=2802641 RepID=UPI001BAE3D0B|nr:tubulin-like doman-containing protein [Kutzneria sp. CA-103260]QUQ63863.1 Tubulin like protein [Kutzneria sp. CA-103260]
MLQKFLFVGVGGSGGVTLRALRALLADYLSEHGYDDGIPDAWQFVHIDVPLEQGAKPERIPLLPKNNYVGLAVEGLRYRDIDEMMCGQGDSVVRHTAVWRPDPTLVKVEPVNGGGRFRAIGRVVLGARMSIAHERLSVAVRAMSGEAANEEFSRVCLRLTGNGTPSTLDTQVLVISSLAGGSGAGLLGDVCDMLGQLLPAAQGQLVSILYTPEVFNEISPADRVGVNPNALAALSELLNSRWNNSPEAPDEFALLRAGGASMAPVQARGPRIPYMIGKSNGKVSYADQYDVYEAVGRGLAVWVTSNEIQDRFSAHEIGNWADRALPRNDNAPAVGAMTELPLSSFGCASVGIGLNRFARYTADRLIREAAEHLLSGHWRRGDEKERNEEQARQSHVDVARVPFIEACGLHEKAIANRHQITDAIRGDVAEADAKTAVVGHVGPRLLDDVTPQWPTNARADQVGKRVIERMDARWGGDFRGYEDVYVANAAAWAARLQNVVQARMADLIAAEGVRVAVDVLRSVITELTDTVVPELLASRDAHNRLVQDMRGRVRKVLAQTTTTMPANHPRVRQAVDAAAECLHAHTEALVDQLAVDLVQDLCENLLAPLRYALTSARERLEIDYTGTAERPSPVRDWPTDNGVVPESYYPARNELLLEKVTDYPTVFETQIRRQVDRKEFGDAIIVARREVITGSRERDDLAQCLVQTRTTWTPRHARLSGGQTPAGAVFTTSFDVAALRDRAKRWIRRPDTSLSRHLAQTLGTYLDDGGRGGQQEAEKRERFRSLLAQTVLMSRPLVDIDAPTLSRVHGGRQIGYREVMTPLPFPPGHPGREAAHRVFANRTDTEFEQLFGGEDTERIDIFTFLDAPVLPAVMSSLAQPIRTQWEQDGVRNALGSFWTWRRARQLPWFVPCPPEVRAAVVRGWFVARFLNQVRCRNSNLRGAPTEIWTPGGYRQFPYPLLGPTIRKHDEWLPAVLESMALTIVGSPTDPYDRLVHLGQSVGERDELADPGELSTWIETGRTAPGAPTPNPKLAGAAGDQPAIRSRIVNETIDEYRKHYEEYREAQLTPQTGLRVSRAWELREDILHALDVIQDSVDAGGDIIDMFGVG